MIRFFTLFILIFILSCQTATQPSSPSTETSVAQVDNKQVLKYKIRPSNLSQNAPLLILLHGFGDNADNFFGIGQRFDPTLLIAGIYAPIDLGNNRNAWFNIDFSTSPLKGNFEEAKIAKQRVLATIEVIITKHNANPKQVYLLGFSQGTMMSLNLALTEPEKIKGALLFSGKLMPDLASKIVEKERLKDLQLFLTHGKQDNVLLVEEGRKIKDKLKELNIKDLTYSEFKGPHTIPFPQLEAAMIWLQERLE